jgi:hypothetical protein
MEKILIYNTQGKLDLFKKLLVNSLPCVNEVFSVKVANVTTHGLARIFQRGISETQQILLKGLAANKLIKFKTQDVSEIRGFRLGNTNFIVTGIVVNDIVLAIDSLNLTRELRQLGYGTREGNGFCVIKTALSKPNKPQTFDAIDGFKIVQKIG